MICWLQLDQERGNQPLGWTPSHGVPVRQGAILTNELLPLNVSLVDASNGTLEAPRIPQCFLAAQKIALSPSLELLHGNKFIEMKIEHDDMKHTSLEEVELHFTWVWLPFPAWLALGGDVRIWLI